MIAFWGGVNGFRTKNENGMFIIRAAVTLRILSCVMEKLFYRKGRREFVGELYSLRSSCSPWVIFWILIAINGNQIAQLVEFALADARDVHNFFDGGKTAVFISKGNDFFRSAGTNTGQGL